MQLKCVAKLEKLPSIMRESIIESRIHSRDETLFDKFKSSGKKMFE